jgi:hypothetical protein
MPSRTALSNTGAREDGAVDSQALAPKDERELHDLSG